MKAKKINKNIVTQIHCYDMNANNNISESRNNAINNISYSHTITMLMEKTSIMLNNENADYGSININYDNDYFNHSIIMIMTEQEERKEELSWV